VDVYRRSEIQMEIPTRIRSPGRFQTVDDNPDDELAFPTLSENVHGIVNIVSNNYILSKF
jgi:hypothetical protein